MKLLSRARPESCPRREDKVLAIQKALRDGSYKIDGTKIANILIHFLSQGLPNRSLHSHLN